MVTSVSDTITAGTLGGGVEWALPYYNLSVKLEYMFIGLGDHHDQLTTCATAIAPSGNAVGGGPFCFNQDFSGVHTAKIGLNYRFGPSVRAY
jgi:opacity protein-like surface antigen